MNATSFAWQPRFESRSKSALVMVAAVLALMVWGVLTGSRVPESAISDDEDRTDSALYGAVIDRMNDGDSYYAAVAVEQPARGFPISPAMNVREPTLAWVTSAVGEPAMVVALWSLVIVAIGLSIWIYGETERRTSWIAAAAVSAAAIGIFAVPSGINVHEVWLSLLICIGVLVYGVGWRRTAMILLLVAALIRELVAPVMVVMAAVAWASGRRKEAVAWAGCVAVFGAFYVVHLIQVHELVNGPSLESPSWVALGGWPFVVDAVRSSSLLTVLPFWVAAVLVPVGLLGWIARRGPLFDPVAAYLLCYSALFCVVGRSNNGYWGTFIGILILPGIVFGIGALRQLLRPRLSAFPNGDAPDDVPSRQGVRGSES